MRQGGYYLFLLIFLVVILLLAISTHQILLLKFIGFFMISGMCLSAYLVTRRKRDQLILLPLGLLALAVYTVTNVSQAPIYLKVFDILLWIGFTSYLILIVFREIFNAETVSSQEIYGAISVYVLTGFLFAFFYDLLLIFDQNAISFDPSRFDGNTLRAGDLMYFSFVTLATVGYGDMTPATPLARAIAVLESVTGIMYVATLVSRFVSIHSGKKGK